MGRTAYLAIGLIFLSAGLILFALSVYGQTWLYIGLGALTLILSVLNGGKMAALAHDAHALKLRSGRIFSPAGIMALFGFFFILMVLFMSLMMMLAFKAAGLIASVLGSGISTFIYSVTVLIASYLLFKYSYDREPYELKSSWGERMDRMYAMPKGMMNAGKDAAEDAISRISSAFSGSRGRP